MKTRTIATAGMLAASTLLATAVAEAQEIYGGGYPQRTGEAIYKGICQGCHMPNAQGAIGAGAYPALAKNPHLASALYPATVVLGGRKAMPNFGDGLSDEQVAAVVNYVRTNFGNHYTDALTADDVKALRGAK